MIAVVDYGVGNFSAKVKSKLLGLDCVVTSKEDLIKADKIILPGVGPLGTL